MKSFESRALQGFSLCDNSTDWNMEKDDAAKSKLPAGRGIAFFVILWYNIKQF